MSSRNKKYFLQLSVATLLLIQFFIMFSPSVASGFLNSLRFESAPNARIRYDIKITAVHNETLAEPIFISQSWNDLGIEEYGKAQILIDDLARAMSRGDISKAQSITTDLAENYIEDFESFDFEVQKIRVEKAPVKSNLANGPSFIDAHWSSDMLETN